MNDNWKPKSGLWKECSWDNSPKGRGGKPGKPHYDLNNGDGGIGKVDEQGNPVSDDAAHPTGQISKTIMDDSGHVFAPNGDYVGNRFNGSLTIMFNPMSPIPFRIPTMPAFTPSLAPALP